MKRGLSRVRQEKRYLAIQSLHYEKGYPVQVLCAILDLNRSSYYKWLNRNTDEQAARDKELIDHLCTLYQESNGIYGYRRMQLNLRRRFGIFCNKKRIYRVMAAIGMKSVIRRKRPNYIRTTPEVTAENILNRKFTAARVNEKMEREFVSFCDRCGQRLDWRNYKKAKKVFPGQRNVHT